MTEKQINEFLKFRKQFTRLEWQELNQAISAREVEKAGKLELDDFDVTLIIERLTKKQLG